MGLSRKKHHDGKQNDSGQILLCTAGRGYYQEWGKEARELHPGDVVVIPAGVKHWHGAAPDSWFAHLAVEVPGEKTSTEWLWSADWKRRYADKEKRDKWIDKSAV